MTPRIAWRACLAYLVLAFLIRGKGVAVSPSAVLEKVDRGLGTQNVRLPSSPNDSSDKGEDRSLAPYFHVPGGDTQTEALPLKETSAEVQIAGVIARVKIRQVFENLGAKPIEAVYVFPGSTRAAVHGMRLKIGKRTIEAKIDRKKAAREQYEAAKQQGKRASLLEQERPNVFTMNVANIMPKDRIEVELDYSELLVPDNGQYEFVYPGVVGPRYGGGADPQKDKWIQNPYLKEGQKEPYAFDIKVHLETGIPIKELTSPSHGVEVSYLSRASADVRLQKPGGGNKDFVLRYRLSGDQIESGLLLARGDKEGFFVLMMEPPLRPSNEQIPPREYIFLLDVSGSMHGFPLDTAKELMRNLLPQLRSSDLFNIVAFSGGSFIMNPQSSIPATPGNIELGLALVGRQTGGGGTELLGGIQAAYGIPRGQPGVSRTVVVVTDGYVGVEAQAFRFIREHLNEANLFAFGIGTSVNRALIEGMARAGLGEPFVVLRPEKAKGEAERLREIIQSPVLSQIAVRFVGFEAREVAPAKLPDLLARRPLVLFGKFQGEPRGKIEVSGFSGKGKFTREIIVNPQAVKPDNAPIRFLWARKWMELLNDQRWVSQAKELEEAITELGLSYNLLSEFTSFVAIDSEVVNKTGGAEQVKQPLPLPEGVSNHAVAAESAPAGTRGAVMMKSVAPMAPPAAKMAAPMEAEFASPAAVAPSVSGADKGGGGLGAGDAPSAAPPVRGKRKLSKGDAFKDEAALGQQSARRAMLTGYQVKDLGDPSAFLKALEPLLETAARTCATQDTLLKLRVTIGKDGQVVKVEVLKTNDPKLGDCLKQALAGLTSATKPIAGKPEGTLELTVKFTAF